MFSALTYNLQLGKKDFSSFTFLSQNLICLLPTLKGVTLLVGAAGIVATTFAVPIRAKRMVDHDLKLAVKALGLLLRKLTAQFEHKRKCERINELQQMISLVNIAEDNLNAAMELLGSAVQMEAPFSSLDGYRKFINEMLILVEQAKAMMETTHSFTTKHTALAELRYHIGAAAAALAKETDRSLLILLDKVAPQDAKTNPDLENRLEDLRNAFQKGRNKFLRSVGQVMPEVEEIERKLETELNFEEMEVREYADFHINELAATYFFVLKLFVVSLRLQRYKPIPYSSWSLGPFWEGLKEPIVYAWGLYSPNFPTVKEYIKSREFFVRVFSSFMFSVAIALALACVLWSELAAKFYNNAPVTSEFLSFSPLFF